MRQLTNWYRIYNYIQDYYSAIYKIYAGCYIACYPVTYYSLDLKNSVFEEELMAGSYEKDGVGPLSGMKWKKIYMLPVYSLQPVKPEYNPSEKGVIYDVRSSFVLPSSYGLKPNHRDVIDLSFAFLDKSEGISFQNMLYIVRRIEISHESEFFQLYQLDVDNADFSSDLLDKQVTEYYTFYDLEKRIIPSQNVAYLTRLHSNLTSVVSELNQLYDKATGFYLEQGD